VTERLAGNAIRSFYGLDTDCRSASDGDCDWSECPQLRDGEPKATGRHCPLDVRPTQELLVHKDGTTQVIFGEW